MLRDDLLGAPAPCACRYELFLDDLPVWGFVGPPPEETNDEEHIYIWTHKSFDLNYNEDRVGRQRSLHAPPFCCARGPLGWPAAGAHVVPCKGGHQR